MIYASRKKFAFWNIKIKEMNLYSNVDIEINSTQNDMLMIMIFTILTLVYKLDVS